MKHLYILGSSSTKYLVDPFTDTDYFHDLLIDDTFLHIRAFPSRSAYKLDYELLDSITFEDGATVLFNFGVVDIRSFSTRYDNIEEVALKYTNTVKEYFKDKNINFGFIEPAPTAHLDDWLIGREGTIYATWVSGSVEERMIDHKKFVDAISLENLFIPIIGPVLDSYHMDSSITNDFNHLNIETNNLILDHILSTVNSL